YAGFGSFPTRRNATPGGLCLPDAALPPPQRRAATSNPDEPSSAAAYIRAAFVGKVGRQRNATVARRPSLLPHNNKLGENHMTDRKTVGSVTYQNAGKDYFEKRGLKRHARVWSLWALGVGAVISGHFSGWNLGMATGGWGGLFIAAIIIAIMYLGLIFSLAEMSPALPHTGGACSFARRALGPWGGFITGLAESIKYIMTPAVIVFFIGSYLTNIFGTPPTYQPLWWIGAY